MRRLSRFLNAHTLHHSAQHGRCRDELAVIADRHATSAATVAPAALAPVVPALPVGRGQLVA